MKKFIVILLLMNVWAFFAFLPAKPPCNKAHPCPPTPTPAITSTPVGYLFNDEFNGTSLDTSKWRTYINVSSLGLSTFYPSQVSVSNGALHLTAADANTSGAVSTIGLFSFQYGKAEARIRVPKGQGFWPAFWLLTIHDNDSFQSRQEIDIMEDRGSDTSRTNFYVHWGVSGNIGSIGSFYSDPSIDYSLDYHIYRFDWQTGRAEFYVDDVLRFSYMSSNVPSDPMKILFDLAVGGSFPGNPDSTTPFPSSMDVDYVRVWRTK